MSNMKVSISTGAFQEKYGDKKMLEIVKEMGADGIDFMLDGQKFDYKNPDSVYSKSDEEIVAYFSDIKKRADELGIAICQTHGRGRGFVNKEQTDGWVLENARKDFLATSALGSPVCVIHAVTTLLMGPNCDPKLMRDLNFDMFTKMISYAKQYGVKVATETFGDAVNFDACDFFGNIDEFIKSYNRVCAVDDFKDHFTICVDTGHSNKATRYNNNPLPADVIRMCGGNVTVLHLHDNDSLTDQHKIPMTGNIDWNDVLTALEEIGYKGYYNLELNLKHFGDELIDETAKFGIKVMRNMLKQRAEQKNAE